jgi:hypothetical protein
MKQCISSPRSVKEPRGNIAAELGRTTGAPLQSSRPVVFFNVAIGHFVGMVHEMEASSSPIVVVLEQGSDAVRPIGEVTRLMQQTKVYDPLIESEGQSAPD